MRAWIGVSAADVAFRLVVQLLTTVVIARALSPEEFGLAALTLTFVVMVGMLLSTPFEEALSQRKVLNTTHLQSALFASFGLTLVLAIASLALAPLLARLAEAPALATLVPLSMLFLFGQGPSAVARAVLRRRRKFVRLAILQSASMAIACGVAVAAALADWGVFALIFQRLIPFVAQPAIAALFALKAGARAMILPKGNRHSLRDLSRVSSFHLLRVGLEYAIPVVMAFLVNGFFGATVLGWLNIAMRLTEPLRMGIASVGHSIVFAQLVKHRGDMRATGAATSTVITNVASAAVPAFVGLAVCAPLLMPLVVGPGWDAAIPIAQSLCLAAAISVPFRYLYSGFLVYERPEYSVFCLGASLASAVVTMNAISMYGTGHDIGLAIVVSEFTAAGLGLFFLTYLGSVRALLPIQDLVMIWISTGVMFAGLHWGTVNFHSFSQDVASLPIMVGCGILIYICGLFFLSRRTFMMLMKLVKR